MPPVKSKEDTWKSSELEKELRGAKGERSGRTASSTKKPEEEKEKKERRHREEKEDKSTRDKGDKDRDRDKDRNRDKDRDRDKVKERDKERDKEKDKSRSHQDAGDKEKSSRHKDDQDDEERRRRREERKRREAEEANGEKVSRKHRDDEARGDWEERKQREHRDRDGDQRDKHKDREKDPERRDKHRSKEGDDGARKRADPELDGRDQKKRKEKYGEADDKGEKDSRHKKSSSKDEVVEDSGHRRHKDKVTDDPDRKNKSKPKEEVEKKKDDERKTKKSSTERGSSQASPGTVDMTSAPGVKMTAAKSERINDPKTKNILSGDQRSGSSAPFLEKLIEKKQIPLLVDSSLDKLKPKDDYDDYEDDFEAYEDDFDDDDGGSSSSDNERAKQAAAPKPGKTKTNRSESDDMMRAINEENERLMKKHNTKAYKSEEKPEKKKDNSSVGESRSFINFSSAKQRQATSQSSVRIGRRAKDVLQMVECDVISYNIFEHHPANEYDLFIRSFGRSDAKQAYVQTCDDNSEREIQTEEITTKERWTQHPLQIDVQASGGDDDKNETEGITDTVSLGKFIQKAGQVLLVLLEENSSEYLHKKVGHKQSNIVVSEAFVELSPVSILEGRHVTYSQFSPIHNQLLLAIYSRSEDQPSNKHASIESKGVICVWNVYEPHSPHKILVCESQPVCCCFSSIKPTLVFAGTIDGAVVVWDLREPSHLITVLRSGDLDYQLRQPSYSTAGIPNENHGSCVVSIAPILPKEVDTRHSRLNNDKSSASTEGSAFQLATLETDSVIHLWVVAEMGQTDLAGSESDLGLCPGSRVKLIKSSVLTLESPIRDTRFKTTVRAFDLQLLPSDNSHFFISTNMGCVVHALRYGGSTIPKAYRPDIDYPVDVTSMDFSPFKEPIFLAGCADGSLRMYHLDNEFPLMTWVGSTESRPIKLVRWCRSRPSVFFVLDTDAYVYIWDLHMDDTSPLKMERIAKCSVTSLALSNDHSATGVGVAGRPPQMVVFLENGASEAHIIKKEFSALMPEEIDQFSKFLQRTY